MHSFIKIIILTGCVVFGIVAIWSGYWALALQRDGYRVSMKIIGHTQLEKTSGNERRVLVHGIVTDKSGSEGRYDFESDSLFAPSAGTVLSYYLLSGPVVMRTNDGQIPGCGHYPWVSPMLSALAASILAVLWMIITKYSSASCYKLSIVILILVFMGAVYMNPLKRMSDIREYVLAQRENNQALSAQHRTR